MYRIVSDITNNRLLCTQLCKYVCEMHRATTFLNSDDNFFTSTAYKLCNYIRSRVLSSILMFSRHAVYYRLLNLLHFCKLNYSRFVRQLTCKQTIYFRYIVQISHRHVEDCFYPSNSALTCACRDSNSTTEELIYTLSNNDGCIAHSQQN